ncbi:MAG: putative 2-aminoethylphosphonate ABC transporter permease subunit [Lachnospiraceae bacterium]|nr:putative 2-aminoethylphosphonate ABC transporter permease subunit [Lachnospiraceae bacterium]
MKKAKTSRLQNLTASILIQKILVIVMLCWFVIFLLVPLLMIFSKVFTDISGNYVGLDNFKTYFENPLLRQSIGHSLWVSFVTAFVSTLLGFLFAYGITRTNMKLKTVFKYLGMLSLFLPTMVHGMALVYLFGAKGFVTQILGIDIGLYGFSGIVMSEIFYTFPQAFLVLIVALQNADNRLYEAATVLGASPVKRFSKVTLPNIRYGLINSFIVCFTLSFTDFGAPSVVGGNYSVLATDVYRQVIGQQNMSMGAVVGVFLTIPAFVAYIIDSMMRRKSEKEQISTKAVVFKPEESKIRDIVYQIISGLIVLCILILIVSVVMSAFVKRWPTDMHFTLDNFNFGEKLVGSGVQSFVNSFKLAGLTAIFGTILVFGSAYLIEKAKVFGKLRAFCRLLAMLPMALPGLVLGLAYIIFFNKQWIEIPFLGIAIENGFHGLYGTLMIMVLCNVIHMFSVTFITATTSLKKLSSEYESVAESMSIPFWKLFFHVSLPMSMTAVLEIFMYYFVNSMVTVSAIVFLYTTQTKPAAIAILNMDDNGDYATAAAMSLLILLINIIVRIVYEIVNVILERKINRWKTGEGLETE